MDQTPTRERLPVAAQVRDGRQSFRLTLECDVELNPQHEQSVLAWPNPR
jgi:hypothetical protein